jgi:AcrR family transcriptional regulator
LYQYFPSKEALVAAVVDRHTEEMMGLVRKAMTEVAAQPVAVAARTLVRVMLDAHRVNPKLHRALVEQVPRVGRLDRIQAIDRESAALVRSYLDAHRDEIQVADTELAAFVCVTTVEALTHTAVVHNPGVLDDARAKNYADEVTRVLLGYLGLKYRRMRGRRAHRSDVRH